MRISLNWLRELVDTPLSPTQLADALTMAGFEVEGIEDRRTWADGVVVGKVLSCESHPDADKLSVCQVDIGEGEASTIVCGASNVRAGVYVPTATVGTYLPIVDLTIKARKVRGQPSAGMICSLAELGLEKDSSGIHILSGESLEVGKDIRPLLGLDDVVLDVTSTANRADALSMAGIAREVAAVTGATLSLPQPKAPKVSESEDLTVTLEDPKACPIYVGTVLENIQIGSSPQWLQQRLQAAGTRPINNVVDVTNYVLLEWGQPLHAFDHDRLKQVVDAPKTLVISVRYGRSEERLQTLDGQERSLQPETLVITANDQPVALAGVMGGEDTEVVDSTRSVMLEAAYFDSAVIRRSARSQGLRTEASARYERGVNPAELTLACDRALQLLQEVAGAQVKQHTSDRTEVGKITPTRTLPLRLARIGQFLGPVKDQPDGSIPPERVRTILESLGCQVDAEDALAWQVQIPPYRYRDLEREIDLIEEVARLYGYNQFADTLPKESAGGVLSPEAVLSRRLRAAFRGAGLTELMHYSVTKPVSDRQAVLANPLFPEYSALRADLLSGFIDAFEFNLNQGNGALNGFEIGHIFWRDDDGIHEAEAVGGILGGDPRQGRWVNGGQERPMTWYEAKGILEQVFQRLGLAVDYRPDSNQEHLHPARTASLWVRGKLQLGVFGQLHPQLCQQRELPREVYAFQLDWQVLTTCLASGSQQAVKYAPYSSYPASGRDLAFFAPLEVSTGVLEKTMTRAGGKLLESVTLFDEYRGESVPEGQRSLAFRLVYRSSDRTLTEADIEPVHQKVRKALEKQFELTLRS